MDIVVNVDIVKHEYTAVNVCYFCLSQDRVLSQLNDHTDLLMYLLGEQGSSLGVERVLLCWECTAVLRRISKFRQRVKYAQFLQQNVAPQDNMSPKSLSNLSIIKLENVDTTGSIECIPENEVVNQWVIDKETKMAPKIKHEEITIDVKEFILQQMEDDRDYETNLEDQNVETSPDLKIKSESQLEMTKTNKNKNKGFIKYKKKAKRTRNPDIDLNNIDSCFTSTLTESDMENMGKNIAHKRKMEKYIKLSCMDCRKVFKSPALLRIHTTFFHILKGESLGPFNCLECSALCTDPPTLRSHWSEHRTVAKCRLCGDLLLWNSSMRAHVELHAYLWTCRLCKDVTAVYRSSKEYGNHYRSLHRRAVCDHCGSRHKTKTALAHHIRLRHQPPFCALCNKEFKDVHCLRRHTYYTHPALLDKAVDPDSTYCVECDRRFPSEFKYKLHLKTAVVHNPNAACSRKCRVPCPDCGKVFTRKSYMNNHRRQVHTKETKHYCEICDKYFVSAWSMKKHVEGVHQKIRQPKNKVCDLCGRAFQTNAVLIKHIRTHTGERPFKCAHCPAAFAQSSALGSHARTQHKAL